MRVQVAPGRWLDHGPSSAIGVLPKAMTLAVRPLHLPRTDYCRAGHYRTADNTRLQQTARGIEQVCRDCARERLQRHRRKVA